MGGPSPEREISVASGRGVALALKRRGYEVVSVDVPVDVNERPQIDERLRTERITMAYLALHGPMGEDGTIQGLLEAMRIPYTGSGVLASALGFFKPVFKRLLMAEGIPTPAFRIVRAPSSRPSSSRGEGEVEGKIGDLTYPVVVKPAAQGSAIGISIVQRPGDLDEALALAGAYGRELLLEAYIEGQEITVGILDDAPLPVIEIRPKEGFYDYRAKYTPGATDYLVPALLSARLAEDVQQLALRAHRLIGCDGATRVDFRVDPQGRPYVLEINTSPGMTETSLLPKAAAAQGIDYDTLVVRILDSAVRRGQPSHNQEDQHETATQPTAHPGPGAGGPACGLADDRGRGDGRDRAHRPTRVAVWDHARGVAFRSPRGGGARSPVGGVQ